MANTMRNQSQNSMSLQSSDSVNKELSITFIKGFALNCSVRSSLPARRGSEIIGGIYTIYNFAIVTP